MQPVPTNITTLSGQLRIILRDELGKFSNGTTALWVEGPPVPTALSCEGIQIVLSDEYVERDRTFMTGDQIAITGYWQGTLTQFGDSPEYVKARVRARDKMQASFQRFSYRAAAEDSRSFRRAMLKFEFDVVLNGIECR